jgi:hypothetical protein
MTSWRNVCFILVILVGGVCAVSKAPPESKDIFDSQGHLLKRVYYQDNNGMKYINHEELFQNNLIYVKNYFPNGVVQSEGGLSAEKIPQGEWRIYDAQGKFRKIKTYAYGQEITPTHQAQLVFFGDKKVIAVIESDLSGNVLEKKYFDLKTYRPCGTWQTYQLVNNACYLKQEQMYPAGSTATMVTTYYIPQGVTESWGLLDDTGRLREKVFYNLDGTTQNMYVK